MGGSKNERATGFSGDLRARELAQHRTRDRRIVEPIGQHVRFGRSVGVLDIYQTQLHVVCPARAVHNARVANRAALPTEPPRIAQLVDHDSPLTRAARGLSPPGARR